MRFAGYQDLALGLDSLFVRLLDSLLNYCKICLNIK